jgi:hypothetical protein
MKHDSNGKNGHRCKVYTPIEEAARSRGHNVQTAVAQRASANGNYANVNGPQVSAYGPGRHTVNVMR